MDNSTTAPSTSSQSHTLQAGETGTATQTDVDGCQGVDVYTPTTAGEMDLSLHAAAASNQADTVHQLLTSHGVTAATTKNGDGQTPLIVAAKRGHESKKVCLCMCVFVRVCLFELLAIVAIIIVVCSSNTSNP